MDLDGMAVFVAVAEAGSLAGAGRRLGMAKSTVSRRLQAYEAAIGVTLFRRSTQAISLTDAGRDHFERVRGLVGEAREAFEEASAATSEPRGLLRISATTGIAQQFLAPLASAFMAEHPKVRIEFILTEARLNLVEDGVDFAVRMGELEDSELLARRIRLAKRVLVASPALLAGRPPIESVSDLRDVPAIVFNPRLDIWEFADGERVKVDWRFAAGGAFIAREACLAGIGVAMLPEGMVRGLVEAGRLEIVLPDIAVPDIAASIIYPRQRHQSAAARAFLEAVLRFAPGR